MKLTPKEEELFRRFDNDLLDNPSTHVDIWLEDSFKSKREEVQITFGYIKKL